MAKQNVTQTDVELADVTDTNAIEVTVSPVETLKAILPEGFDFNVDKAVQSAQKALETMYNTTEASKPQFTVEQKPTDEQKEQIAAIDKQLDAIKASLDYAGSLLPATGLESETLLKKEADVKVVAAIFPKYADELLKWGRARRSAEYKAKKDLENTELARLETEWSKATSVCMAKMEKGEMPEMEEILAQKEAKVAYEQYKLAIAETIIVETPVTVPDGFSLAKSSVFRTDETGKLFVCTSSNSTDKTVEIKLVAVSK